MIFKNTLIDNLLKKYRENFQKRCFDVLLRVSSKGHKEQAHCILVSCLALLWTAVQQNLSGSGEAVGERRDLG